MKWLELAEVDKTLVGVIQLVLMEQFMFTCSIELATFLKREPARMQRSLVNMQTNTWNHMENNLRMFVNHLGRR